MQFYHVRATYVQSKLTTNKASSQENQVTHRFGCSVKYAEFELTNVLYVKV